MKSRIIEESIKSLRQEGLRFSVDTLAERLKVSKKTIYRHFPTKEALAQAMYERYYSDLKGRIKEITQQKEPERSDALLLCYFDSSRMAHKEIFNKYCLNNVIGNFALQHHQDIWNAIKPYICGEMGDGDAQILKLILDGAFEKAISCNIDPEIVIKMLRKMK